MFVKDIMNTDLCTIKKDYSISKALDIMSNNNYHRLPVIDDDNNLIGLLSESVIKSNTPNDTTSLSIYELNYLLNKLKVEDIMIKDVIVIDKNDLLEKAAVKLRVNNIGCLPVVENNKLIGIITHNDIFDAFVDLLGYKNNVCRYIINIQEDKPGILKDISLSFSENDISISRFAVYKNTRGIELVVVTDGKKSQGCLDELKKHGYDVTDVIEIDNI